MTTPRQLRVLALYLCISVPLASSCAREESGLEPGGSGNDGGTSAKAGSSSAAGTAAGGKGTAGSASAFGGTTGTSGASTGGKTGTAGTAAQGGEGTGGVAGTSAGGKGGAGGTGGVPPDVLENADVIVYYQTTHATPSDKTIQMKLNLVNQSADALPLASVKIRYWCTAEVTPTLHQYYVGPAIQGNAAAYVSDGANSHILLTFTGKTLAKGADMNSSEIQLEASSSTTAFDQADDFSWAPTAKTATPNDKVTLYLDDVLVWGCEPSGKCAKDDTGAGGAGGAGGADNAGGADSGAAGQAAGGSP